jgi:hypothetical protein
MARRQNGRQVVHTCRVRQGQNVGAKLVEADVLHAQHGAGLVVDEQQCAVLGGQLVEVTGHG